MRNGPEVDEGRPDELKSTVAQKRADLIIYKQQVPQCLQMRLRHSAALHSLSGMYQGCCSFNIRYINMPSKLMLHVTSRSFSADTGGPC